VHRPTPPTNPSVSPPLAQAPEYITPWGWPDDVASWNFGDGSNIASTVTLTIRVFAKGCKTAALFINGHQLGSPVPFQANLTAVFLEVPYAPGALEARAMGCSREYDAAYGHSSGLEVLAGTGAGAAVVTNTAGTTTLSTTLRTAGAPASLRLILDKPHNASSTITHDRTAGDLAYVSVEVLDSAGVMVADAEVAVQFTMTAASSSSASAAPSTPSAILAPLPLRILAVGSGNPKDRASFTAPNRTTWRGRALVVIEPTPGVYPGGVVLVATAEGLPPTQLQLYTA
jgi:hypothetical protein